MESLTVAHNLVVEVLDAPPCYALRLLATPVPDSWRVGLWLLIEVQLFEFVEPQALAHPPALTVVVLRDTVRAHGAPTPQAVH